MRPATKLPNINLSNNKSMPSLDESESTMSGLPISYRKGNNKNDEKRVTILPVGLKDNIFLEEDPVKLDKI